MFDVVLYTFQYINYHSPEIIKRQSCSSTFKVYLHKNLRSAFMIYFE